MESAPRSCRMSSAAMVSRRMRLSAKAMSSGMLASRWWHTMSMSRCSSSVFTVKGRVGLVEDGSTFFRPATLMMSGACPPPAPSVWKAWMVRPLKAAMVSSTKPDLVQRVGVDHHLHVVVVGHRQRAVDGRRRRAPVLVQLEAGGAAQDLLDQRLGLRGVALAGEGEVHREGVGRLDHARQVPGAGRAGGGGGAGGGAGAAADHHGDAGVQRLLDLLRADEVDVAVDAAGGEDLALAGDRLRARADDDVDARLHVRVAGLADAGDAPVAQADVGFDDAAVVDDQRVGDDGVDGALGAA